MKLIVGLGNPGDKYAATRHNAGFWFVERLAAGSGTVLRKDGKFQALVGRHDASGAWLVLPQSFMNSSGRPVQMMAGFFKIQPPDILVVHDELDLPPGVARLKQGGGVAGHNGLKDISARLGSHDYWRLRLGIGRPADRGAAIDYVLHKPAQDERAAIDAAMERALEILPLILAGDTQDAMLKLHTREPEPKPERAAAAAPAEAPARAPAAAAVEPQPERAATAPEPPDAPRGAAPKPSSIERFGEAARVDALARGRPAAGPDPASDGANAAEAGTSGDETGADRKSGLNSLLKKFLPGSGATRKK